MDTSANNSISRGVLIECGSSLERTFYTFSTDCEHVKSKKIIRALSLFNLRTPLFRALSVVNDKLVDGFVDLCELRKRETRRGII